MRAMKHDIHRPIHKSNLSGGFTNLVNRLKGTTFTLGSGYVDTTLGTAARIGIGILPSLSVTASGLQ